MTSKKQSGFSLVELMIVVAIIGVFSALTIPKIIDVTQRGRLEKFIGDFQDTAVRMRSTAMQTRRAVVMEVRGGDTPMMWVNVLNGAYCDAAAIEQRCVFFQAELMANRFYDLAQTNIVESGSRIDKVGFLTYAGGDENPCGTPPIAGSYAAGFALCYNGLGELHVRNSADANVECDSVLSPTPGNAWNKTCTLGPSTKATVSGFGDINDGAMVSFNRFEGTTAMDVQRIIKLPSTGTPYIEVYE